MSLFKYLDMLVILEDSCVCPTKTELVYAEIHVKIHYFVAL